MWTNDAFGGAGGFDSSNVDTPGGLSDKKKEANAVADVCIKQILESTGDYLKIGNSEIGFFCVIGIVRKIEASSMKVVYTVEDNSGTIPVFQFINEDRPNDGGVSVVENTYCEIYGSKKEKDQKKFIMGFCVKPLTDLRAITVHRLSVIHTLLKLEQLVQQESEWFSARQESVGGGAVLSTGTTGLQFGGVENSYGFNPQQLLVYRAIQKCRREGGASKDEIGTSLAVQLPPSLLDNILDFLVSEGHIYTTMDENHFMATDFAV